MNNDGTVGSQLMKSERCPRQCRHPGSTVLSMYISTYERENILRESASSGRGLPALELARSVELFLSLM